MMKKSSIWPLIRLVPKQTHFGFVHFARLAASISVLLVILTFVSFATAGLRQNPIAKYNETQGDFGTKIHAVFADAFNLGIDFKGGILVEAVAPKAIDIADLRSELHTLPIRDPQVQGFDKPNQVMVRYLADHEDMERTTKIVRDAISQKYPGTTFPPASFVGSKVSGELYQNGVMALVA